MNKDRLNVGLPSQPAHNERIINIEYIQKIPFSKIQKLIFLLYMNLLSIPIQFWTLKDP